VEDSTGGLAGGQRSLAARVSQYIREQIIASRLKPGDRILEIPLAKELGVSQPTVREALKELEYEGFVTKMARKGTYVTSLSSEDIQKISEVRALLEPAAVAKAAVHLTPKSSQRLREITEKMAQALDAGDRLTFHHLDMTFHRTIWKLSDNEYLERALSRLLFSLFAFVLSQQEASVFADALRQHHEILAGLTSGDPEESVKRFWDATWDFWAKHHQVRLERDATSPVGVRSIASGLGMKDHVSRAG